MGLDANVILIIPTLFMQYRFKEPRLNNKVGRAGKFYYKESLTLYLPSEG